MYTDKVVKENKEKRGTGEVRYKLVRESGEWGNNK